MAMGVWQPGGEKPPEAQRAGWAPQQENSVTPKAAGCSPKCSEISRICPELGSQALLKGKAWFYSENVWSQWWTESHYSCDENLQRFDPDYTGSAPTPAAPQRKRHALPWGKYYLLQSPLFCYTVSGIQETLLNEWISEWMQTLAIHLSSRSPHW